MNGPADRVQGETAADVAILDEQVLLEAASEDLTEAASIAALFLRLAGEQFRRMREALVHGDADTVGRVAHQAAGGAAACGLIRLSDRLRALEQAAGARAAGPMEHRLERAGDELRHAGQALRKFLGEDVR